MTVSPEEVLAFWFGDLDADGRVDAAHSARWWQKDAAFDREIRDRFLGLHRKIVDGRHDGWLEAAPGWLAYLVVLDQFSRNMFRDTADMFAHDDRALAAAIAGIAKGYDRALASDQRLFAYLPLMHSEAMAHQDRCVQLLEAHRNSVEGAARTAADRSLDAALRHREIVDRFGRFPHRNALLGRQSSAAELAFLEEPNSSF